MGSTLATIFLFHFFSHFDHMFFSYFCVQKIFTVIFHARRRRITHPLGQGPPEYQGNHDFLFQQNILEYNFLLKRYSSSLPLVGFPQRRNCCRYVALVALNLVVAVWIIQLRRSLHHSKIATIISKLSFYTEMHKFGKPIEIYLPRVIPQ